MIITMINRLIQSRESLNLKIMVKTKKASPNGKAFLFLNFDILLIKPFAYG